MTAELIEFYAKDGVALNGYIIKNKKKTKKLLIEIHGMTSNCFKKRERVIAETAVKMTNVDTICINTRGSEITKYIKNMQGEKKLAGILTRAQSGSNKSSVFLYENDRRRC